PGEAGTAWRPDLPGDSHAPRCPGNRAGPAPLAVRDQEVRPGPQDPVRTVGEARTGGRAGPIILRAPAVEVRRGHRPGRAEKAPPGVVESGPDPRRLAPRCVRRQ